MQTFDACHLRFLWPHLHRWLHKFTFGCDRNFAELRRLSPNIQVFLALVPRKRITQLFTGAVIQLTQRLISNTSIISYIVQYTAINLQIYVKTVQFIQCKGDIAVVDIKQHKSQFKNSNFTITQSAKFF